MIEKTPDVVGGSARIAGTRIPVWTLESYRRQGLTDAQILDSFPSLGVADLAAAWAYVEAHPDEIERDIQENDEALGGLVGCTGYHGPRKTLSEMDEAKQRALALLEEGFKLGGAIRATRDELHER